MRIELSFNGLRDLLAMHWQLYAYIYTYTHPQTNPYIYIYYLSIIFSKYSYLSRRSIKRYIYFLLLTLIKEIGVHVQILLKSANFYLISFLERVINHPLLEKRHLPNLSMMAVFLPFSAIFFQQNPSVLCSIFCQAFSCAFSIYWLPTNHLHWSVGLK